MLKLPLPLKRPVLKFPIFEIATATTTYKKRTGVTEHPVMDFDMTLPSNGGGTEFNHTNDNTRYKARLPNRIVLKEQDWEVTLVSLSFPIRDHHKLRILSSFPRGTVVTKVNGRVTYVTSRNILDNRPVTADVRIEDITDPDTKTDVTPLQSGMTFMRHWVFACKKAIQKALLKTIQDDDTLKGARWGNPSNTQKGLQSFIFTPQDSLIIDGTDTIKDSPYIHIDILARLDQYLGIIDRLNEGKNIRHYDRGVDVNTNTGPAGFRQIDYINGIPYIEHHNEVNWDIIGLDSGWFEQAFSSKYRVVRILINICDSSVVGDDRTNVLGEAKFDAMMAEGQQYYEPTHLRYVPLRDRELDVIEITLDDLSGNIVDLGTGITSVVLHFKRRGDIKSGHNC